MAEIEVQAMNQHGVPIGAPWRGANIAEIRKWCLRLSTWGPIDGFAIQGIGVVRIVRTPDGHVTGFSRLVGGEFVTGGPGLIAL